VINLNKPKISRKGWIFLLMVVAALAISETSMLPGDDKANQSEEPVINISVNTSLINASLNDTESMEIGRTPKVVSGNLSLYNVLQVEKRGNGGLLGCYSLIASNESYTQYEWAQAVGNEAEGVQAGDVYAGKTAGEAFTVAVLDLTAKRSYPLNPYCTVRVKDMLTGDTVKQKIRFIVS
jgi:hypothetical protein